MNITEAIFLGIIQGATEFIPVSSSGHLAIAPYLLGWQTPSIIFDLALHAGTLLALLWFFRSKILAIIKSLLNFKSTKVQDQDNRHVAFNIVIATIPAAIIGFFLKDTISALYKSDDPETLKLSIIYTSCALIVVGIFFILSDFIFKNTKTIKLEKLGYLPALLIGVAQSFALFRGVSRSGITLIAGQVFKLSRVDAAEFSFLMSIPIMVLTTILGIKDLLELDSAVIQNEAMLAGVGALSAFISGSFAISYLLKYLRSRGLAFFGWYRIAFGLFTLLLILR